MKKVYTHLKKIRFKYLLITCLLFNSLSSKSQTNFNANSFAVPLNFNSNEGAGASFLAKGDFNNDGKIDLAFTNTLTNKLIILRNGNYFVGAGSYATGSAPKGVAVEDLNLDGKSDIIVANSGDHTLSIYKNISTGFPTYSIAFEFVQTIPVGYYPTHIAIAEIDRNNKPDIIVTCSGTKNVSILTNNTFFESFSFSSPKDFPTGPSSPGSIAVGELDYNSNDPSIDLAVINNSNFTFATLRNTTIRDRYTVVDFEIGIHALNNWAPQKVIKIVDLNKDNKADIIMSGGTGGYRIFKNTSAYNSGISLNSPIDVLASGTRGNLGLDVADLDKDGLPDLISVKDGSIAVSRNLSTAAQIDGTTFAPEIFLNNVLNPQQLITADCDGDGRVDIVSVNYFNSSISVYLNKIGDPEPGPNLTLTTEAKQFNLNWSVNNSSNIKSYEIEYATAANPLPSVITVPATQNSFVFEAPEAGQTYYFRIASIDNADLKSLYSNVASAFIKFDQIITMLEMRRVSAPSSGIIIGATSTNTTIPITYTSSNPSVLSIIDGKASAIKRGEAIITASQAGNDLYNPAQSVDQLVSVVIKKGGALAMVNNDTSNLLTEDKELVFNNLITPNGDGKNDFWIIKNVSQHPNNEVKIYTTNGSLVYSKKGYQNDWDGSYNGSILPQGSYLYIFTPSKDEQPIKGYITLVRNQ